MSKAANDYLKRISNALGSKLIDGNSIYSGKEGHIRLAREIGPVLLEYDESGRNEILQASYSTVYVKGCALSPLLNAKEWVGAILDGFNDAKKLWGRT